MWRYIGDGSWIFGIPARDLTDDEAVTIGVERIKHSKLYQRVRDKKPKLAIVEDDQKEREE